MDTNETNITLHKTIREFTHDLSSPLLALSNRISTLGALMDQLAAHCESQGMELPGDIAHKHRELLKGLRYGVDELRSHNQVFRDKYQALSPPELQSPINKPGKSAITHRVLVVDDDLLNREIIADLIRARDYQVDCAENGAHALEMSINNHYDLILMDCLMPGLDGFTTTRHIREQHPEVHPIIVGITSMPRETYFEPGLDAGMDEFIPKPINQAALDRVLRKYSPVP